MSLAELLLSQLLDPFRIGLLLALVFTAYNTAGAVGMAVPLILGAAFVAVLIPTTMQSEDVAKTTAIPDAGLSPTPFWSASSSPAGWPGNVSWRQEKSRATPAQSKNPGRRTCRGFLFSGLNPSGVRQRPS